MKNLWVIPTDKPSRLFYNVGGALLFTKHQHYNGVNIYITSDEEIIGGKEWFLDLTDNSLFKNEADELMSKVLFPDCKKIILTTDQELIKHGVQAIDDEFLEWFVKNPSCEEVEVHELKLFNPDTNESGFCKWELDIPKEEPKFTSGQPFLEKADEIIVIHRPKQETLVEAAENNYPEGDVWNVEQAVIRRLAFMKGAKYQAEIMYSEEELRNAMNWMLTQYFEFHEWPATGRVDHYVQSIKQQEQ